MTGFDSDPKMMRSQQNKDAPETIEADETHAPRTRSDVDDASRRDREAAKTGQDTQSANETMDDVFDENREASGTGRTADRMMENVATDGLASLAQKDRSLLGR